MALVALIIPGPKLVKVASGSFARTSHASQLSRPVLVLGVDAPDGRNADKHDLQVTQAYWDALPAEVRDHLRCRIVPALENIEQAHTIEGLRMGLTG